MNSHDIKHTLSLKKKGNIQSTGGLGDLADFSRENSP
jgi:hypothetical protein